MGSLLIGIKRRRYRILPSFPLELFVHNIIEQAQIFFVEKTIVMEPRPVDVGEVSGGQL
jgi:hypothetical protein